MKKFIVFFVFYLPGLVFGQDHFMSDFAKALTRELNRMADMGAGFEPSLKADNVFFLDGGTFGINIESKGGVDLYFLLKYSHDSEPALLVSVFSSHHCSIDLDSSEALAEAALKLLLVTKDSQDQNINIRMKVIRDFLVNKRRQQLEQKEKNHPASNPESAKPKPPTGLR